MKHSIFFKSVEIKAAILDYIIEKSQENPYDETCFQCEYFIGCTEAGDIRCKKSIYCLNARITEVMKECKKKKWYVKSKDSQDTTLCIS